MKQLQEGSIRAVSYVKMFLHASVTATLDMQSRDLHLETLASGTWIENQRIYKLI